MKTVLTFLQILDQNFWKSSSLDRSRKPINSTVHVGTDLKHCTFLLLLPSIYLEVVDDYYNTDTLTFKYSKSEGFSNFSMISIFNLKKFIFTILWLRYRYRTLFGIAEIKLMEVVFNYQCKRSVPVTFAYFEINNSLKNWKGFFELLKWKVSVAGYYNLGHILSCPGYDFF